ncbi:hypothetical protein N0V90_004940 [Kalmusia sp. IMI 367209]|nr:hypothetical protein N0V90_004940 [Kalmusia sp. IMI 367209]
MEEKDVMYCKPYLGVIVDEIKATIGGSPSGTGCVYSSRLIFKNSDAVDVFNNEHGQLAALARDAYEEMEKQWDANTPGKRKPSVLTAMFLKREVYLSSSLKGLGISISPIWDMKSKSILDSLPQGLKDCMTKCEADFRRRQGDESLNTHRRRGTCGEIMAMLQYLSQNPNEQSCIGAQFVSVHRKNGVLQVIHPCGMGQINDVPANETWGCQLPIILCGGSSIDDTKLVFKTYAIGKMKQNNDELESDEDYEKSVRYHTIKWAYIVS